MNELLEKSPLDLARKIRNLEISPVEVTEAFIDRIKRVNPDLNALVIDRFDEAMEEAQLAEEQIVNQDDDPPPLLGVPCTIKEMISVESHPITCGSLYRESARSYRDAKVVRILRKAGAIPIGLTNVPELGLWIETDNPVYGRTNNPMKLDRTSGGSSGGEAAIIRAGGSPFGLGSDMGGSIRIPSAFCGLYGHKSTVGTISLEGHFPQDHSSVGMDGLPEPSIASIGPMTRHATDLKFLFSLLREDDTVELSNNETPTSIIDDMTVYTVADPDIRFTSNTAKEQQDAVKETANALAEEGATVKEFSNDFFYESPAIYTTYLEEEDFPETSTLVGNGRKISVFKELGRSLLFERNHTLPMLTLCLMDKFYTPGDSARRKRMQKVEAMRTELTETLGKDGILIMPPYPTVAPPHGHTLYGPFDLMYSAILNVLDLPVTSVPVGTNDEGLPTGVQVVTAPGKDELGLDTAIHLEKLLGNPDPMTIQEI